VPYASKTHKKAALDGDRFPTIYESHRNLLVVCNGANFLNFATARIRSLWRVIVAILASHCKFDTPSVFSGSAVVRMIVRKQRRPIEATRSASICVLTIY
jgi:hypothetical protein